MLISDLMENAYKYHQMRGRTQFARASWRVWKSHLSRLLGDFPAEQLATKQQQEYRAKRTAEGALPATINKELQILRRAYRLGAQNEPPLVSKVPHFLLVPLNNARKVFVDLASLNKIREGAAKHSLWMRTAVEMAYAYGWRRGELLSLKVGDVDLIDGTIRLQTSKNGEPREAPISSTVRPFLEALCEGKQPEESLLGQTISSFQYERRKVYKSLKLDGKFIFHDFRRTSAKIKRSAGVPTSTIMELQGWKSEAMFRRYAIVDRQDKLDALKRQEQWEEQRKAAASV